MPAAAELFGPHDDEEELHDGLPEGDLPTSAEFDYPHLESPLGEEGEEEEELLRDEEQQLEEHELHRGRLGRNGPRQVHRRDPGGSTPKKSSTSSSSPSRRRPSSGKSEAEDSAPRGRPRGNLPPAPPFDGDRKKNPKVFKQWLQKVDSYVEISKKIIDESEIGLRLHSALEGQAAEYLENIPARTFGGPEGWKVLLQVLQEKFDERKMHKIGGALRGFFKMSLTEKNTTLTEMCDLLDKSARACREAGLQIPDEIMTYQFFEQAGCTMERQANILLRTGGDYEWQKVKAAVDLLYPQTYVNRGRTTYDKPSDGRSSYGKGRTAHETQGHWEPEVSTEEVDLEEWIVSEDPIESLADAEVEYLPEPLARELHEVFATHRENRQKLAAAVKARGFYLKSGKGKGRSGGGGKGYSKSKGKGKDSTRSSSSSRSSSRPKGKGKARGMSLDELKAISTCGDCGELGHWRGDPQCKQPKKAHEAHLDYETEEPQENDDDYWTEWQPDYDDSHTGWMTGGGAERNVADTSTDRAAYPKSTEFNSGRKATPTSTTTKVQKPDAPLQSHDAYEVIKDLNRMKRKATGDTGTTSRPSSSSSVLLAANAEDRTKPFDVFTATADVQKQIEEKRLKARGHTSSAPEAIREAQERLGLPVIEEEPGFCVWDLLKPVPKTPPKVDLDKVRVALVVSNELHPGLPGPDEPRPHHVPTHRGRIEYEKGIESIYSRDTSTLSDEQYEERRRCGGLVHGGTRRTSRKTLSRQTTSAASPRGPVRFLDYDFAMKIIFPEDDLSMQEFLVGGDRVPRDVLSNTRMKPTVKDKTAYLTIDTACENTVGGLTQVRQVASIIESKHSVKPLITEENESYRFGPGEPRTSNHRWHMPVGIGGCAMVIKTSVLDDTLPESGKIPWLAGQDWLRLVRAVVDIGEQKIYLKALETEAELFVDHTGHLVVAVNDFPVTGWPQDRQASQDAYAGVLWATGKAYMQPNFAATHVYSPEDDPFCDGSLQERTPCIVASDKWEYLLDHPQVYIRHHHRPRTSRFHPEEVVDGPQPDELQSVRVTIKHGYQNELIDVWDAPQRLLHEEPWTGYTVLFGKDCDPGLDVGPLLPAWQPQGVDVVFENAETRRVHPASVKTSVQKRILKSFDKSVKSPDLPIDRQAVRFNVPAEEFGSSLRSRARTAAPDAKAFESQRRLCVAAMEPPAAQGDDLPQGDRLQPGFNSHDEPVETPLTSFGGLWGSPDLPRPDDRGVESGGLATDHAPSDHSEQELRTAMEPELPLPAEGLPSPGGAWKTLWQRPWEVLGVHKLWNGLAWTGLQGADCPDPGHRLPGPRGNKGQARRQGVEGRDCTPRGSQRSLLQQVLWVIVFLTTYLYGSSLWSSGLQAAGEEGHDKGHQGGEGQWSEAHSRSRPSSGLNSDPQRRGSGRHHVDLQRTLSSPGPSKLKPGQQKRMKHMAREALAASKWQQKMVMQRLQGGRWPRKHFQFDLVEIFGGTSMVTIRGATLWKMKVLQPIDIRYGIDLRKRSMRRWLMTTLRRFKPRLAMVEFPCTPWSILQRNVNYKGREDELRELQEQDRPFLKLTEDVFKTQVDHGGHAIAENPATADSQKQDEIVRLRNKYFETTSCLCMFGLTGKAGLPMKKRVRFIATHPYFIEELDKQCDGSRVHELVEGSNAAASACYPPLLADAICRAYWRIVVEEDFGTMTLNEKDDTNTAWFADADKSEDKWRPLFDDAMEVLGRKTQASIFLAPDSELYAKIARLVPWQIMNIQIAHLPKAKRVRPGLEDCHRCSALLLNDDSIVLETEFLKTAQAPRERFVQPVRLAIFVLGYAPGDPADPAPQQEPPRQPVPVEPHDDGALLEPKESPVLTKQTYADEQWFIGPPLTNKQKKLAPMLVKVHKNLGHPAQPDLTRALIQDGKVEPDAIELSRRLRCGTCERSKRPGIPRPSSFKVIGAFNSKLCIDFVYVTDANQDNHAFLHLLEPNGSFNVFWPCDTREPGHVYDLVTMLWCSWAGYPKELWVDQDGAFQGEFAEKMRSNGVILDHPPAAAHWQVGEVEAYNRAFQHLAAKLVDELSLAGERDMKTLACAAGAAMNDKIRSAGCSAYQWVFGKNPSLPDDILSPDGKYEALQAMELDDELRKRNRVRALADEKLAAYRLNEAVRAAILRKSHPMKETYDPGEIVAFWREARYRQGKKGQKGKRIPAAWYRGTIIGPHKGDSSTKQNNFWISSGGKCVLAAREQIRPAFGTELWPVHEHLLQQVQDNPPEEYYDIRSSQLPPVPEDDDLEEVHAVPVFEPEEELLDRAPEEDEQAMNAEPHEDGSPEPGEAEQSLGSDHTTLAPETSTRAPGTPVTGIIRPMEQPPAVKKLRVTPSGSASSAAGVAPLQLDVELPAASPEVARHTELVLREDHWELLPHRGLLLRHHRRPRRALFDPGHVRRLPVHLDAFSSRRTTWMRGRNGWSKHVDDWVINSAKVMNQPWTGTTIFKLTLKNKDFEAHTVLEVDKQLTRKERKALEKELPWTSIPEEQKPLFREALVREWTTWLRYKAVEVLDLACSKHVESHFDPARILASRVCYRDKRAATPWLEVKPKARLVCRGDQDPDLLELRRDAPTMTRLSLMLILQLSAACADWFLVCADITGAFLQGDQSLARRKDPLFIRQPREGLPGLLPGQLLLVVRGIFGLANSPRLFWRYLRDSLIKLGFVQSTLDKAVFLFYSDHELVLVVGAHVDDLLCAGKPGIGDKVLDSLRSQFDFGEWKDIRTEPTLTYGGKEITKRDGIVTLSQESFIRALTLTPVPKWRVLMKDSSLTAQEVTELKSGGGCLHWLVGQTRPDLAAGTSLAMGGQPTVQNLLEINRLLRDALKSKDWCLKFRQIPLESARVIGFSDASWANADDLKSQAGYLIFLTGPNVFTLEGDVANLVEWRSHRIRRKCRSTLAAETMALDASTDAAMFTRELLAEMLIESYMPTQSGKLDPSILPVANATDCRSLYDLLCKDGPVSSTQEKRLTLDIGALREAAEEIEPSNEDIKEVYKWVSTQVQRADHLTKVKPSHELRDILDEGHLSMVATADAAVATSPLPTSRSMQLLSRVAHLASKVTHFFVFKEDNQCKNSKSASRSSRSV